MSDGAIVPREDSPQSISEELERRRSEARNLELRVSRKEAELQRAKEEQELLKEMRTMNEMIIRKKERQLSEGVASGVKISPESLAELNALGDALRLENRKTVELQSEADVTSHQMEEVERSLENTEKQLLEAKRSTGWDVDRNSARTETAMESEFKEKKRQLSSLASEQRTISELSERLKQQAEELQAKVDAAEDMDERFAEAEEELRQANMRYRELIEEVKSNERIQKKTERVLTVANTQNKYKCIRQLEGEKRVLHNNLSKLRETNVSNSRSILSLEVRLRQLETRLEAVNGFLREVFAEVEDDEPMEDVPEGAVEVPLAQFEELSAALELSRETVAQRDDQLDEHDCKIEQMERKVVILQNAIASREVSAQVQARGRDRQQRSMYASHSRRRSQLRTERDQLAVENTVLRNRLELL
ncbi:protein of unknown function - conserved [Leishmania donovani]|uniref:Uncharacterized protein n=3 Tax=Leishmania donovani species complex TaxID=38574 RepID=A4I045_LEIIN|nr:conserved hypothetical protein [Leishmania infantum JPCM5]XP_003860910.1 hypothetical protein, conserved [Leishmania donovani]CAC9488935.1 hypothetical_protein_-_conserved [Leishmania infantum]TPP50347.1 hypothetical protein CGC21_17650 [Leishmania donovani]TPP51416.1 hypothetical protein CGC20_18540 [Leishmania donovani]CAJ1988879.1 protein of unknown function - conserved [Leishmania donovani]CAM68112.1 conserved hypothetical protein [Leishmania infantum JPCM5]|eukprot:XP_001465686.1 conserved hypothetical protein [Leishmania infantum JPCM5]